MTIRTPERVRRLLGREGWWYRFLERAEALALRLARAPARAAPLCVWGTWAAMLLGSLALVNAYTTNLPFADELRLITQPLTPQWLWQQHAEHRVPLAKLIWLGSLRLTNYDFRIGNSISVLAVGAVAFAMLRTARSLRGRTALSDAFFPLALLSFGQAICFLWWWVFNHILAPLLACCLLVVLLLRGRLPTARSAVLAATILLLLSLSGPAGLPYVLALAPWLGYRLVARWRSPSRRHGRCEWLLATGLALLAVLLVGLYFVGYRGTPDAGSFAGAQANLRTSLEGSLQVLSISLGPAVRPYWRLAGSALLTLLALSVVLLVVVVLAQPEERPRALALLSFIGAAVSLLLVVGRARGARGEEYALSGVYLNMALPALCCVYLVWVVYGTPVLRPLVQMCLLGATCLFFSANLASGVAVGKSLRTRGRAFEQDMRAGVPPFILAERHAVTLSPASADVGEIARRLREMQKAGIPQFSRMAGDPAFREVALPVAPIGVHQVTWHKGVGYSYGADPGQSSVDFALGPPASATATADLRAAGSALTDGGSVAGGAAARRPGSPRFVYAVRLKVAYGEQTSGWASFRMAWGSGDAQTGGGEEVPGCSGGADLRVETIPRDMWSRLFRGGREKTLTIWVNSNMDRFRICPDTRPFAFAVSEITLLVP